MSWLQKKVCRLCNGYENGGIICTFINFAGVMGAEIYFYWLRFYLRDAVLVARGSEFA